MNIPDPDQSTGSRSSQILIHNTGRHQISVFLVYASCDGISNWKLSQNEEQKVRFPVSQFDLRQS